MDIYHDEDTWETFLDEFYEVFSISDLMKRKIFICGSYLEENFNTLKEIRKEINKSESYLGFFELSFKKTHNENFIFKFDLLARISDEILMIIEHDKGGHMIELGIIISVKDYLEKTMVFVLKNAPMTQMLIRGSLLTPFFMENENLFYFESGTELKTIISMLYFKTNQI
ncbi:MAG: hypothetical protein GF317_22025 [Candidatus Lokiarchaeota archaeon]|nr:hypothetical protein [Candidatus Lokiarchaeota archaeon]MBD3202138.1 hypothetical protein [Candidatus Lokiarchaeota archaeon]